MATTLYQDCINTSVSGVQKFQIHSYLTTADTDSSDLPYPEIFVFSVVSGTDPKKDTFLRVATILDLTTLSRGRDTAIQMAATLYLSSGFVVLYDDVLTATKAKLLIQQRVDALIGDWKTYNASFITPSSIVLPATDSTIVAAAKATYITAKATQTAAESALAAANVVVVSKTSLSTSANAATVAASADSVACQQASTIFHAGTSAEATFRAAVDAFLNTTPSGAINFVARIVQLLTEDMTQPGGTGTTWQLEDTAYQDFFSRFVTYQNYLNGLVAAQATEIANGKANLDAVDAFLFVGANAMCPKKATLAITSQQAKNTADAAVATAQTALTQATAAATAAQQNTEAALAALLAVCPSFDPNA